ncbi:hypothetical protein TorRG33x02_163260 [Trema orientale]|uniref:Uncharacterized protein n=1 Tax=Trema orientale TaxID=63057 RepID=A0A2P5EQX4_TREOI|nr:hypothetical protein TorRG33x02_163260 [Trema orientale]
MGLVEVTTGGEGIRVIGSGLGAKTVGEWPKKLVGVVWAETKSSMIAHGGGIAFLFGFALFEKSTVAW